VQRDAERLFDEYLALAARDGDREAWARLVARWQPRLLAHAWRLLGDAERARDAVQEAWIEILRGLGGLDDVVAFPAWAYRITTRRCQRAFGRADRQRLVEDAGDGEEASSADAAAEDAPLDDALDLARLLAALDALPPGQRAALAMFHLEHLGVAEIAIALEIPPGTVKTRLMHARRRLRAALASPALTGDTP
jgi:RNA polymerase sigma-70 factor (ECF subfamily)